MLRRLRNRSLGWKLAALVLPTGGLGLILVTSAYVGYEWISARRTVTGETGLLAEVVGANTAAALSFGDADSAQQTLDSLVGVPAIALACLYGRGGPELTGDAPETLVAAYPADARGRCPAAAPDEDPGARGNRLEVVRDVAVRGERVGRLLLVRDLREIQRAITVQSVFGAGAFSVALGALLLILVTALRRTILEPVQRLAGKAGDIRTSRDYTLRADKLAEDEIGELVDSFNAMLDEIQAAQRQLVEAEKMASLGALVAGVSHEVNTPIGISVTAASHLQDELQQLQTRYGAGELTHADMTRFLAHCHETLSLMQTHLQRAVEIISGFKQVAVDQSADVVRDFELGAYIRDIAQGLSPRFKRSPHALDLKTDDPVLVQSYPGAIAQVVSNLAMNALLHAFDAKAHGRVEVTVRQDGPDAVIEVADDGSGIAAAHRGHVFEPFFTTKRGKGGSGLGLNIVYNLVTQKLRGRVSFETEEGRGTRFNVRFPRVVRS